MPPGSLYCLCPIAAGAWQLLCSVTPEGRAQACTLCSWDCRAEQLGGGQRRAWHDSSLSSGRT